MAGTCLALTAGVVLAAALTIQVAQSGTRSVAEANKQVVLAFADLTFNKHEVAKAFQQYVGPAYTQHNPQVPDGVDGAVKGLTYVTSTLYPKLHLEVKRAVAEGDLVVIHSRMTRNDKDLAGGRGQAVVDIFRLQSGKIVEHWDVLQDVPEKSANNNTMF